MIVLIRIQDAFFTLPLQSQGNFDSIWVFLHEYELFWTGSCSFELIAGWLGGGGQFSMSGCGWFRMVADGFRWFRMVSGGFGRFRMVSGGFGWFAVLVPTLTKQFSFPHNVIVSFSNASNVPLFDITCSFKIEDFPSTV